MEWILNGAHYFYRKWNEVLEEKFFEIDHKKWSPLYLALSACGLLYLRFKVKTRYWQKLGKGKHDNFLDSTRESNMKFVPFSRNKGAIT